MRRYRKHGIQRLVGYVVLVYAVILAGALGMSWLNSHVTTPAASGSFIPVLSFPAYLPPFLTALIPFVYGSVKARVFLRKDGERRRQLSWPTVDAMDGVAFERFVGEALEQRGWKVAYTRTSGDFGADIVAERGKDRMLVQCKRYNHPVGLEAVQQVYAALAHYGGTRGVVVTNHRFTQAAKTLATSTHIDLWDRSIIETFLSPVPVEPRKLARQLWRRYGYAGVNWWWRYPRLGILVSTLYPILTGWVWYRNGFIVAVLSAGLLWLLSLAALIRVETADVPSTSI